MYIALQINVYKNSTLQIQQNYLSARDARKALLSPPKNESSSQICYRERRHRFSITKRVKGKSDSPAERGEEGAGISGPAHPPPSLSLPAVSAASVSAPNELCAEGTPKTKADEGRVAVT